jgi:hypothetical protein
MSTDARGERLSATEIGERQRHASGHELTPLQASLEEAFMDIDAGRHRVLPLVDVPEEGEWWQREQRRAPSRLRGFHTPGA